MNSSKTEPSPSPVEKANRTVTGAGGKKIQPPATNATGNQTRVEQAEARTAQAEARTEQAKTRTELAETRTEQCETRTEQAKTRTEQAETRTEQAETRTEQAETALENIVHKDAGSRREVSARLHKEFPIDIIAEQNSPLERLTSRQREILQLVAEGQNTKQIAELLSVSPKTVEYHRMKLMAGLNLHDVPGLVRYAVRAGLISPET